MPCQQTQHPTDGVARRFVTGPGPGNVLRQPRTKAAVHDPRHRLVRISGALATAAYMAWSSNTNRRPLAEAQHRKIGIRGKFCAASPSECDKLFFDLLGRKPSVHRVLSLCHRAHHVWGPTGPVRDLLVTRSTPGPCRRHQKEPKGYLNAVTRRAVDVNCPPPQTIFLFGGFFASGGVGMVRCD